ncbi:YqgE/AlgH family protein [Moraxella sp. VT-16-12]|uniref:YqgE/AlgH family protein n=1 Tax=Moraxella sp. VT-16-12 TaxID=2014877 RepID=UPI000B7D70EA|nr:YqgE/AlgH family protein [Moraxella sp. VT-16-12]TWV82461.1 hypothetical protein CEW93_006025 [Moraxella sp. VT-16-12]
MTFKNLTHHFLIPSPTMNDERFFDALIYVCRHTLQGAWGFIINQPLNIGSVGSILDELDLPSSQRNMNTPAMHGGFVRPEAGFVLHTGLPEYRSSFVIGENVCLTTSKDILQRLSCDELSHYLLCMGFCNWQAGQLEREIRQGDWLICPSDLQILFGADFADRLSLAYQKLGINLDKYTDQIGRA